MGQVGKVAVFLLETTIISLFAIDGCSSCSRYSVVERILGRNVSLTCTIPESMSCNTINWMNVTSTKPTQITNTARTSVMSDGDRGVMNIFRTTPYDEGNYSCVCTTGSAPSANPSMVKIYNLKLFCQAEVVVNLESNLHKSRLHSPSVPIIINAYGRDRIKLKCPKGSTFRTNCRYVLVTESGDFTYNFQVLLVHHLCVILCQLQWERDVVCTFNFSLNVSTIESSTIDSSTIESSTTEYFTQPAIRGQKNGEDDAVKDTSGKFGVIIPVGIGILSVVFVGIAFLLWLFVLSPKSRTTAPSGEDVNQVNTADTTVNNPQYENVRPEVYEVPQDFAGSNQFYQELNRPMDKSEKLLQANSTPAQGANVYEPLSQVSLVENKVHPMQLAARDVEHLELEEEETGVKEENLGLPFSKNDGYEIPRINPRK